MSTTRRSSPARFGALGFLAIALGCGGFAAYMVARMLDAHGYTGEKVQPVVVAAADLPAAEILRPEHFEIAMWPESSVPLGAFSAVEEIFASQGDTPVPATGIQKGEPVTLQRLARKEQGTALAAILRPGYRAVAVKVDDSVGRAGLVYPGAVVDVLATIRDPEGRGPSTRIAVENARVLAVEQETDVATRRRQQPEGGLSAAQGGIDGTVVTLEVAPADAEIVSLAMREGQIDLALRNGTDDAPAATKGATPAEFSAFAPSFRIGEDAEAAELAQSTKPSRSSERSSRPRSRRRIELNVPDSADLPPQARKGGSGGGTIETYAAQ